MDQILNKVIKIEKNAQEILDSVAERRKQLEQESKQAWEAYRDGLERRKQETLEKARLAAADARDRKMKTLQDEHNKALAALEQEFDTCAPRLEEEIFSRIVSGDGEDKGK